MNSILAGLFFALCMVVFFAGLIAIIVYCVQMTPATAEGVHGYARGGIDLWAGGQEEPPRSPTAPSSSLHRKPHNSLLGSSTASDADWRMGQSAVWEADMQEAMTREIRPEKTTTTTTKKKRNKFNMAVKYIINQEGLWGKPFPSTRTRMKH